MSKYVLERSSMACAAPLILQIVMPTITDSRLDPIVKPFVEFVVETVMF